MKTPVLFLAAGVMLGVSCKKQDSTEKLTVNTQAATVQPLAVSSNISVNWDNYANQTTYTSSNAAADFGNVTGWVNSRAMISNGNLRVTLLPNALSGAGGLIGNVDISDGSEYELDYSIRFHSAFDWSRGGKVGFGFLVGDGNTGGDPGWDGNGGSLRLMWYQTDAGRVFFQPYVYYRDQSGQYGETFGKSYPSSGSISKSTTYNVHMYIKSNTGSNNNGWVQIRINGTTLLDQAIRWTTNDSKRLIRTLSFHTFRGGSQSYWQSTSTGYIYYDNLVVHKIN
ncbi:polysaccharide lyase [uncultured Chitinophaga sp.]|uniref:polysaccharide lyase n=1 Tax=uncultured Chitinophaga sp. TaxID=339340 RepID=UPI0025EB9AF3|nr:hypothetical protein [uncultured Chitinophaga sp.]